MARKFSFKLKVSWLLPGSRVHLPFLKANCGVAIVYMKPVAIMSSYGFCPQLWMIIVLPCLDWLAEHRGRQNQQSIDFSMYDTCGGREFKLNRAAPPVAVSAALRHRSCPLLASTGRLRGTAAILLSMMENQAVSRLSPLTTICWRNSPS